MEGTKPAHAHTRPPPPRPREPLAGRLTWAWTPRNGVTCRRTLLPAPGNWPARRAAGVLAPLPLAVVRTLSRAATPDAPQKPQNNNRPVLPGRRGRPLHPPGPGAGPAQAHPEQGELAVWWAGVGGRKKRRGERRRRAGPIRAAAAVGAGRRRRPQSRPPSSSPHEFAPPFSPHVHRWLATRSGPAWPCSGRTTTSTPR